MKWLLRAKRAIADLADALANTQVGDGASMIGFDRENAYEVNTVGEAVSEALDAVKTLTAKAGHLSVQLINEGTTIELGLPQAVRKTDNVQFAGARVNQLNTTSGGITATVADVPGTLGVYGGPWCFRVTLAVTGTPTSTSYPIGLFDVTFPVPYTNKPMVLCLPANRATSVAQAAAASAVTVPDADISVNGFKLRSGTSTPPANGQVYQWYFLVIEPRNV